MTRKINLILQIILGLFLLVMGLNKFIPAELVPMPEMSEPAAEAMAAFAATGYIMPMVAITEIVVGVLLLVRLCVPLAFVLLAPLSVNIVLFHLFLDPATILFAAMVATLNLAFLVVYRRKYLPLLGSG